ncbi:MAG TPA: sodium:solute symporter [bacterium]|nr:sodium:solute symporter [bacterium]
MAVLDFAIVVLYLLGTLFIGFWMQKKASESITSYFLGNKTIPWWALASSGMASNLDLSGTMIIVALVYALGANGFYIELRGGVVLIMAFLTAFMGKWNRRANVMTLAEWMEFRFGSGPEGRLARLVTAITSLLFTVAMVTYFAIGGGKFLDKFLGIPSFWGLSSEFWAAAILIFVSAVYTIASGLYGVVWTDFFQMVLILAMILYITIRAFGIELPENLLISMPLKDGGFQTYPTTFSEWSNVLPKWNLDLDPANAYSIYNLFGVAVLFYFFKVAFEGSGGATNYMAQRYFAARNDREAGLISVLWTFLLSFRWIFVAALAIWGLSLGAQITDPEKVLPMVVDTLPMGIKGFLVAGFMAAAMSTFVSTVNAGAAYWVKDIYLVLIRPHASGKSAMMQSYLASTVVVVMGLSLMLVIKNINDIWGWITMSISAGMVIPFMIRWYWWRLNGYGYTIGLATGTLAAILWKLIMPENTEEYFSFIFSCGLSILGTVAGTLLTRPTDDKVLEHFYTVTRPFGFWGPYKRRRDASAAIAIDRENRRDLLSLLFAAPWQISLFLFMMSLVMRQWSQTLMLALILALCSLGMYLFWYRHLSLQERAEQ